MKKKNTKSAERLDYWYGLYERARLAAADQYAELDRHMEQYLGSYEIDGSEERASTVRNITYEIVESQISSDIPPPKVDPACFSEKKSRCARSIERLLSSIRDKLPYEQMNDIDERYTYIYGGSVWYAEWDNTIRTGREVGGVRLYCLSPKDFIPQPNVLAVEDMEYCFLRFITTREEVVRKYGIGRDRLEYLEYDYRSKDPTADTDTVEVVVTFYKDRDGEIGKFVFSGEVTLLDIPCFYRRKRQICQSCNEPIDECRCGGKHYLAEDEVYETLPEGIKLSDGTVIPALSPALSEDGELSITETRIPYYTPKSFPLVIRKNTSGDGKLLGQSDCKYLRPEQQAINKIESRILQKLLRAGVTPVVPEDATVSLNNSVFGQVIKMKPGETTAQYGKVDTTPDISQDIAEAERLYDHAKRILGISDALQGISANRNESGYARQLQISQATGRLESKRKMKHTAYAALDRVIFELYLAFADEPRALVYKDAYGRIHNAEFNRYDFIEYDTLECKYYYDDGYLFSVDLNGGAEYQREAIWQRNLDNLRAGTLGNPEEPITLLRYWQCQERAHYPYARENVEYFRLAVEEAAKGGMMDAEEIQA